MFREPFQQPQPAANGDENIKYVEKNLSSLSPHETYIYLESLDGVAFNDVAHKILTKAGMDYQKIREATNDSRADILEEVLKVLRRSSLEEDSLKNTIEEVG